MCWSSPSQIFGRSACHRQSLFTCRKHTLVHTSRVGQYSSGHTEAALALVRVGMVADAHNIFVSIEQMCEHITSVIILLYR